MQPDTQSDTRPQSNTNRLEKVAYYSFLATIVLAPLVFLTTPYLVLDLAKSFVIAVGTLVSAACYGLIYLRQREISAPPRPIFWLGILMAISLLISSFSSIHISKALFGQGFEITTASFLLVLFVAAWNAYETIRRNPESTLTIYGALVLPFAVLFIWHGARLLFGQTFLSLSVLNSATATVLGKWSDLGIYGAFIMIISLAALLAMPMPRRMKALTTVLGLIGLAVTLFVNHRTTWIAVAVVFGLMSVSLFLQKRNQTSFWGRIAWLPTVLCIVAILFAWKGNTLTAPLVQKTGTQYAELTLPWQMTLDVVSGAIKNYPWFGVGPNHFNQAFLTYKPVGINLTDAWATEFNTGFGLIPTMIASQGLVGTLLWILLFVILGIMAVRAIKSWPEDPKTRFIFLSSSFSAVFLWLMLVLYVPSHALILFTFIVTGIAVASFVNHGIAAPLNISPQMGIRARVLMPGAMVLAVVVVVVWGLIYVKKTVALAYFDAGVRAISSRQDFDGADRDFRTALSFDSSDVYWQSISENARLKATQLISTATTSSATLATNISNQINVGVSAARQAILYDPTNYYNYVSEARISQVGASVKMPNAYDNAVRAYTDAIRLNPQNPALYSGLAQLQASNNNLDAALQTLGAALQVKSNYLDAVYLISQIQAAKGNLTDAITAAQVAIQINPQNPLLYFQLGLLQYNAKDYSSAKLSMDKAVQLQPDYANAKYFLGLAAARVGDTANAIQQFEDLKRTNPDNGEVAFILTNLRAGKSPFTNAQPPVTTTPEKRASLPVKEKR